MSVLLCITFLFEKFVKMVVLKMENDIFSWDKLYWLC